MTPIGAHRTAAAQRQQGHEHPTTSAAPLHNTARAQVQTAASPAAAAGPTSEAGLQRGGSQGRHRSFHAARHLGADQLGDVDMQHAWQRQQQQPRRRGRSSRMPDSTRRLPSTSSDVPDAPQLTTLISRSASPAALQELCMRYGPHFNFIHASSALVTLAKLPCSPYLPEGLAHARGRRWEAAGAGQYRLGSAGSGSGVLASVSDVAACAQVVTRLVQQHMQQLPPRALANCLWAAAKLASALAAQLPDTGTASSASLRAPRNASGSYALAAAGSSSCFELALQLLARVPDAVPGFEAQHVSNTLYAMATLFSLTACSTPPGAPSAPAAQPLPPGSSFPDVLSHCCTSRGLPPLNGSALLVALQHHAGPQLLAGMAPQGMANTLYSLAVLEQQPDEGWLCEVLDAAQRRLAVFEPQHISSSLWALAKMGFHPGDDWLDCALGAAAWKLPLCSPQALANIVWALAKLGYSPLPEPQQQEQQQQRGPMHMLLNELLVQCPGFGPQDCANSLWALATLHRTSHQQLADSQARQGELVGTLAEGGPEWGGRPPCAVGLWMRCSVALLRRAAEVSGQASVQELCNALWAASLLLPPLAQSTAATGQAGTAGEEEGSTEAVTAAVPALVLLLRQLRGQLDQCKPQELANAALAAARLGLAAPTQQQQHMHPGQQAAGSAPTGRRHLSLAPVPGIGPRSASTPVLAGKWSAQQAETVDEASSDWWRSFWSASLQLLPRAEPRHVVAMLWSARGAGRGTAPQQWVDRMLMQAARPSGAGMEGGGDPQGETLLTGGGQLGANALASLLCSLPLVGVRPSAAAVLPLLLLLEQAAAEGRLGPQGVAAVLWAYSWLVRDPDAQQGKGAGRPQPQGATHGHGAKAQRLAPWEMSGVMGSDAAVADTTDVRSPSDPEAVLWLASVGRTLCRCFLSAPNLERSSPRDLSTGTLALAMMGRRPPAAGVKRLAAALAQHVAVLGVRELAVLLVGLPRLGCMLGPKLLVKARARVLQLRPHASGSGAASGEGLSARAQILLMQQGQGGGGLSGDEALMEAVAPLLLSGRQGRAWGKQELLALIARLEARAGKRQQRVQGAK